MRKACIVTSILLAITLSCVQFYLLGLSNIVVLAISFLINAMISIWMGLNINRYLNVIENYTSCYNFVNTFIVSLSVTNSISGALKQCLLGCDKRIIQDLNGVSEMEDLDKVKYLKKTFNNNYYYQFLHVLNCFLNQGGDILKSSKFLLKSGQIEQEYIDGCKKNTIKKLISIILLWLLIIFLLVGLKVGVLSNFKALLETKEFILAIVGFFAFVDFSIYISVKRMTKLDIPGIKNYEKNKKILRKN